MPLNIRALQTPPTYTLQQVPTFDMGTLLNITATSGVQATSPLYVQHFKGITVVLNVTNYNAGAITVTINGVDPTSGNTFAILTSGSLTSTVTTAHTLYPGLTNSATANQSTYQNGILPTSIQVSVNAAAAASYTVSGILTT